MLEPLTHAGGVVLRDRGDAAAVLLVRARRPPHDWVLPKGHIEPGETPEEAAVREVREESGVEAVIQGAVGDDVFVTSREQVVVRYFLMRSSAGGVSPEHREVRWCLREDADARLVFESARAIVRRAFDMADREPLPAPTGG